MYKKIFKISLIISIFGGCANKSLSKDSPPKKQNETITESSFIGKVLVGSLALLATGGNVGKAMKASKFGGNASGYFVGKKLSDMQKRYKEKEEELISNIIKIDEESTELKEKNSQILIELISMQEKIEELNENKQIKESQKSVRQKSIKNKLQDKKKNLLSLLSKNKQVSKKLALSKNKANEYKYTKEDKKEILKSVAFLEKNSQNYEKNINKNIASINKMISTL